MLLTESIQIEELKLYVEESSVIIELLHIKYIKIVNLNFLSFIAKKKRGFVK